MRGHHEKDGGRVASLGPFDDAPERTREAVPRERARPRQHQRLLASLEQLIDDAVGRLTHQLDEKRPIGTSGAGAVGSLDVQPLNAELLRDEFVAYMTEHRDPVRLPDEFFGGEYAADFIPPTGVEYHVALGPGGECHEDGLPKHTWVSRYPRWSWDGTNLAREADGEFCVEGFYQRGSVPDEYAAANEKYRLLRDHWSLRAAEARARLRDRARIARVTFLPDSMWRPDVRGWLRRYQEQRLHPSEFPDSVKAALVDVEFFPTHNMFFYESTGEVRSDGAGGEYTVIGITPGFSDEFGPVDGSPLEPLPALLMWPGRHAEGEVRPRDKVDNAEYKAWEGAWEDMQREGRRLKERRDRE
jgi:hypothetical protein